MNPLPAYGILVSGDLVGDSLVYIAGRFGIPRSIKSFLKSLGLVSGGIEQMRTVFLSSPKKFIVLSKIILGVGVGGIAFAGSSGIPYPRFIKTCFITSLLQYIFYLSLGILFGAAYERISRYLNYFASATIILGFMFIVFRIIQSKLKKL
jgi:membrane protein DedA with SNARE-associated domain